MRLGPDQWNTWSVFWPMVAQNSEISQSVFASVNLFFLSHNSFLFLRARMKQTFIYSGHRTSWEAVNLNKGTCTYRTKLVENTSFLGDLFQMRPVQRPVSSFLISKYITKSRFLQGHRDNTQAIAIMFGTHPTGLLCWCQFTMEKMTRVKTRYASGWDKHQNTHFSEIMAKCISNGKGQICTFCDQKNSWWKHLQCLHDALSGHSV